jgi:serine protease Do
MREEMARLSFFDDDFYSPKIPRAVKKFRARKATTTLSKKPSPRWSTLKISVVSSVSSATVAILLFSWITGVGDHRAATTMAQGSGVPGSGQTAYAGDPYERIIQVSDEVSPSVVSIVNRQKKDGASVEAGLGSGIIFKKEAGRALILTNFHVIDGADELEIVLNNGQSKIAKVVGKDFTSDIAVISVDDEGLPKAAEIGDSAKLRRGETVLAIGNALGLGESLSSGIVSKTLMSVPISLSGDGTYDWEREVIQTDAAINDGNSGGALVNLRGQVIGVNAMKIADVGVEGIGFAIPMNNAMDIANALIHDGRVIRAYMGVYTIDLNSTYAPITDEQRKDLKLPASVKDGVIVMEAAGPSEKSGLKLNDVLVKFDDQPIPTTVELRKYLFTKKKVGDTMTVTYYRDGEERTANVTLGDRPQE